MLLKKYQFINFSGSIYWLLCVTFFHFSVSWFSEMQFDVIYLKTWGGTRPYVASWTLEFCSCVFVFGRTWLQILLHCISQCLLLFVSSRFSWLVDAMCLPCLAVKIRSGDWLLLMRGGSVCCNPLGPPVNLWTTGIVGQQFVMSFHCMKFVPVASSMSLSVPSSLWAEMS